MPSFWASFVNSLGVATASMVALLWGLVIVGFFAWVYQEINLTGTEQKRRRFPCAVSSISNEIEEERDGAIVQERSEGTYGTNFTIISAQLRTTSNAVLPRDTRERLLVSISSADDGC